MEHAHLHENERLLAKLQPGWSVLASSLISTTLVALVGIAAAVVLFAGVSALWGMVAVVVIVLPAALVGWLRFRQWKAAHLLITTDRLLFHYGKTLLSPSRLTTSFVRRASGVMEHVSQASDHATITVKWPQYQESHAGRANAFGLLDRTRPLSVRYGTADTEREVVFPSVPYAQDLKHFLDKADSAVRQGKQETLRAFVLKPSGQRDGTDGTEVIP